MSDPAKKTPTGVILLKETTFKTDHRGDNWCVTWAHDDSQITSMCDGNWLGMDDGKWIRLAEFHNRLYRIVGSPDQFVREDIPSYPDFRSQKWSWFGYGVITIDGTIYSAISKTPRLHFSGPFRGIKLLKSSDNGQTWGRVNRNGEMRVMDPLDERWDEVSPEEMFFLEEEGITREEITAYPFSWVDFVQEGKDHSSSKDGYVYIYSPEGAYAHKLLLARAPKAEFENRSSWEYFVQYGKDNQPKWSRNLADRGCVHEFPEKNASGEHFGWYSWIPSVVWNEGLGLYIMVNGGTYGGRSGQFSTADSDYFNTWMHNKTGSLGFWYSETPYGPWHEFFYTDYWTADHPADLTYQPKLSPKWISADGKEMILIWSRKPQGRSPADYTWNQMRIRIET